MSSALDIVMFIFQVLSGIVLLYGIYRLYKFYRSYVFDKRFGPYSVELLVDDSDSLFDSITYLYKGIRNKLSKVFIKSKLLVDYSKKYEKYSTKSRVTSIDLMNYISTKLFIGLFCLFLLIFSCMFKYVKLDLYLLLLVFLLGFFGLDIYLMIMDKVKMNRIEKDMGKAIVVMNNAFKSGYSIMQAIYLVYTELDGPISVEFKKMYMDITFGLNMEVVFKRFSERVNCVEASYMSTSLAVLNKTGGNIVQVFNSVERSLMTRKKLKDELDSVSASARAVFKILVCIPIVLILMLLILNPAYFVPLFTTPIGILCLILSALIYILYIFIIKKIVYVEVKL
jgi:tight adherence protein B